MTAPTVELVTFANVVQRIRVKRDSAREETKKAGWQRLLGLAQSVAAEATDDSLTAGRTWRLVRIGVQGYQGVPAETRLVLDLDPTPGITVLHGPNGSGKSSLADALDTAMRGAPRPPYTTGTGGKAPLWERDHLARGADESEVEVVLADGPDRLEVRYRLTGTGDSERSARLVHGDTEEEVILGDHWNSAVAGHRPVFGYAAIERRVQRSGELQEFLEPLLAFGSCLEALEAALDEATEPTTSAARKWSQAVEQARTAADAVDAERRAGGDSDLPALTWPDAGSNRDAWLAEHGLQDTGLPLPVLTDGDVDSCLEAAAAVDSALTALEEAQDSLQARLAVPLRQLLHEAQARDEHGATCPVCLSDGVPWRERLDSSVAALAAADEQRSNAADALRTLRQALQGPLQAVLAVLAEAELPEPLAPGEVRLRTDREAVLAALNDHGDQPVTAVRNAARDLLNALQTPDVTAAIEEGRRQSERFRQWRLARRDAAQPLLDVWLKDGMLAAEQPEWKAAKTGLRTLQAELRSERSEALRDATGEAVQQLLMDAGVDLVGLTVSQREAQLEITDASGAPVRLSMLSAGQRNALLLAPLLRTSGPGPFGFLVLDDPVHAFDAVRIDRLAAILGRLAQDRRVVVLTHDDRLREHLLVQAVSTDLRTVSRDADGVVHVDRSAPAWQLLLDDAEAALALDSAHDGVGRTDVVRGLCRMAVDDACRAALHADAATGDRNIVGELAALDERGLTRSRLKHLVQSLPSSGLALRAQSALDALGERLNDWNRASHGNEPQSAADAAEVQLARDVCTRLAGDP